MTGKILIILGIYLMGDALFSIITYWSKEPWWAQEIRVIRLLIGASIVVMGFLT